MIQATTDDAPKSGAITPAPSLPHVVECKSFAAFFEPIAAFDCIEAAEAYKDVCATANRRFEYRLRSYYEG